MRLLNTSTLELRTFGQDRPPYAILSHTWTRHEPPFEAFAPRKHFSAYISRMRKKRKYAKIFWSCKLARDSGLDWIWIDTCCIDKSSSAELTEAINSMYAWYEAAEVCFAYMRDVSDKDDPVDEDSSFARSIWFTRGWTLQELIAPRTVEFYSTNWVRIGSKWEYAATIEKITGIHRSVLKEPYFSGLKRQRQYSVAQRMSWAANRRTTRPEDLAYSLIGLFNIHMPLLYGEGETNAFLRLQSEIAKLANDQSLFAWGRWPLSANDISEDALIVGGSLYAQHPSRFSFSGDIIPLRRNDGGLAWSSEFSLPNDGYLRIRLRVAENTARPDMRESHIAFLECELLHDPDRVVGFFLHEYDRVEGMPVGVHVYKREFATLAKFPRKMAIDAPLRDVFLSSVY
ncbi:HET-domain-containing protein [Hypoxylon trugodes]|uniref:HET-domain-containing protein n=1 Tax=Hypoxylon trugodes TaxID=326681 RepID=UPI0021935BC1|nr:HET-domain-containing protein [Hypoxylon trugodes]KAI1392357.1 HET-domain-containing protein [Hypoxylon trugodes]